MKRRNPDRPLAFCAIEMRGDRKRLEDMVMTSDYPGVQKAIEEGVENDARIRGFRTVDPERGTINIDLGRMMVQSGLADYVPESIAHLPYEIREAADYRASVPGYEMSDETRHIIEKFGPKRQ